MKKATEDKRERQKKNRPNPTRPVITLHISGLYT